MLEQIRKDAELLDSDAIAVGPFARLDANAVAARDGKTRGAITNLFGSQAAFQAETMALALNAGDWIEPIEFPAPADFPTRRGVGRRLLGRPVGARAAARRQADRELRVPLGALAQHRALRPLERADQPAQHGGVRAVAGAAGGGARSEALDHFGMALRDGHDGQRPRLRDRQHDRGRLAQPVPHRPATPPTRRSRSPRLCAARAACCGVGRRSLRAIRRTASRPGGDGRRDAFASRPTPWSIDEDAA